MTLKWFYYDKASLSSFVPSNVKGPPGSHPNIDSFKSEFTRSEDFSYTARREFDRKWETKVLPTRFVLDLILGLNND